MSSLGICIPFSISIFIKLRWLHSNSNNLIDAAKIAEVRYTPQTQFEGTPHLLLHHLEYQQVAASNSLHQQPRSPYFTECHTICHNIFSILNSPKQLGVLPSSDILGKMLLTSTKSFGTYCNYRIQANRRFKLVIYPKNTGHWPWIRQPRCLQKYVIKPMQLFMTPRIGQ